MPRGSSVLCWDRHPQQQQRRALDIEACSKPCRDFLVALGSALCSAEMVTAHKTTARTLCSAGVLETQQKGMCGEGRVW